MQALAEEARFEVARRLTDIDARQRHSFLEATVCAMDAHVRYYQRSMEVRLMAHTLLQLAGRCLVGRTAGSA